MLIGSNNKAETVSSALSRPCLAAEKNRPHRLGMAIAFSLRKAA
jgi:hypothetical protein